MKSEWEHRQEIVEICKLIHQKGYISATDGNVSVRTGKNRIITTPKGFGKGFIATDDLVVCDLQGKVISGKWLPSSEIKMHLCVYQLRPDVKASIHAHPPVSTAFTIAGLSLAKCILPEVVLSLGIIPTAEYATPTTEEVPQSIKNYITQYDALILERHGSLTVGKDLKDAYFKLEKLEHTATISFIARMLGEVRTLSPTQIEKLIALQTTEEEKKRSLQCLECGACGHSAPDKKDAPDKTSLRELVLEEIEKELLKG